MTGASAIRK